MGATVSVRHYRPALSGCSVALVVSGSKSLQEQIREIQKLISDAEDTLAQAKWALETLVFRLAQEDEDEAPGA
jgi:hypothetical protein